MLSTWLDDTQTWAEPASLSGFQKAIPIEWISRLPESTNKPSTCKHKFPVERILQARHSDTTTEKQLQAFLPQTRWQH